LDSTLNHQASTINHLKDLLSVNLAGWIACAVFVLGGLKVLVDLWKSLTGAAEKRDVTLASRGPTKAECDAMHRNISEKFSSIDLNLAEGVQRRRLIHQAISDTADKARESAETLRLETKEDISKVYGKIDELSEGVARLETASESNASRLTTIEFDIKQLLKRMV
jgi:hypothetical protein